MAITWSSDMATGAQPLDDEHRRLIARLNALIVSVGEGRERLVVEKALRDAGDAAVRHFSRDEDCAMRDRCPGLETNGAARAEFVGILARFRSDFERGGATEAIGLGLERELEAWVGRYLPGRDAALLPCVAQAQA